MTSVRPGTISAFAVAVLSAAAALAQLNPTVNVVPRPQAPVPGECEQGLAQGQPRTLIAEAPPQPRPAPAKEGTAPPTLDLKTRLRAAQTGAEQGDREGFKSALVTARSAIASYPTGGERDAANDVLRVYEDLERLWDYAFTSPSGAFFDASTDNGALLTMLRRYPDYAKFIADSTLTIGGTVVYPSSESRKFLVAEASRRLGRLGVRLPERMAEVPAPKPAPAPAPVGAKPTAPTLAPVHRAPRPSPAASTRPVRKPRTQIAQSHAVPPKPRHVETTPPPAPQPAPQPVLQPPPAPAPEPQPPAVETTPPPTTTTSVAAPTTTTASTTTTNPPVQQQGGGRVNLLFAIILIVVGVGVLIVLLRASD